jgi:membrane protein DedA with SNARE-associated domain
MALVSDLLSWLQGLPEPGLVAAAGGLVFAECTIGLGFLAPGESGLLIAATTANTVPRFVVLWLVVTLCATAGDALGYLIGCRFGPRLRETKLIRKYGLDAWDKATSVLERRGAWAVFFARFLPVVRTLTPAAGTSGLPFRRFLPAAAAGASCWSLAHISIGAALGEAAKRIEGVLNTGGLIVVGVLAAVGVFFLLRLKKRKAPAPDVPNESFATSAGSPARATRVRPGRTRAAPSRRQRRARTALPVAQPAKPSASSAPPATNGQDPVPGATAGAGVRARSYPPSLPSAR